MRLQIRPALHQAWRAAGRLQIGIEPGHGVVLDGLSAQDEQVLDMLDGSTGLDGLLRRARHAGVAPERVRRLVDTLARAGVLLPDRAPGAGATSLGAQARAQLRPDAETLSLAYPEGDGWDVVADRSRRSAGVMGLGRTGLAIAGHLARAGVGTVLLEDAGRVGEADVSPGGYRPDHVGRRRRAAAAAVVAEACPHVRTAVTGDLHPDLVVVVAQGALDPRDADALLREDVAHLAVVLRERDVSIGPLVLPGRSACLRCVDLQRADRDPEWPRVLAQVARPAVRGRQREETTLAALAAAVAGAQALTHLDGRVRPAAVGTTLEAALPEGLVGFRSWAAHPRCGCTWPPRRLARTPPSATAADDDTMGA